MTGEANVPPTYLLTPGAIEVDYRLVLWLRCPKCGNEHRKLLGPLDHLELPGDHFWVEKCCGQRCIVRVSASDICQVMESLDAMQRKGLVVVADP